MLKLLRQALFLSGLLFSFMHPLAIYSQKPADTDIDELKELEKEIEEIISNMSPEEQEEIQKIADAIDQMSPEELELYLDELFEQEENQETEEIGKPESTATVPEKPRESEVTLPTDMELMAREIIQSIIDHIDSFLVKAHSIPDLDLRIQDWLHEKSLKDWPAGTSWLQIKPDIDKLVSRLKMSLDHIGKTQKYKYLPYIAQDEALINNLKKIHTLLVQQEPSIQESLFGIEELPQASIAPMQSVLSQLAEAIFVLKIPEELINLMAKFDPEAAKIKQAEEEATKKAFQEAKKTPRTAPSITAGKAERPTTAKSDSKIKFPSFKPETSISGAGGPEIEKAPPSTKRSADKKSDGKDDKGKTDKDKKDKDKKKKKKKVKLPGIKRRISKKPVVTRAPQSIRPRVSAPRQKLVDVEETLTVINATLKKVTDILAQEQFDTFFNTIKEQTVPDTQIVQEFIPSVSRSLGPRGGLIDQLQRLKRQLRKAQKNQKAFYQQQLTDITERYKGIFTHLIDDINELEKIKADIPHEKQYLYLGGSANLPEFEAELSPEEQILRAETQERLNQLVIDIPTPTSFLDIMKLINEAQILIADITEKQEESIEPTE